MLKLFMKDNKLETEIVRVPDEKETKITMPPVVLVDSKTGNLLFGNAVLPCSNNRINSVTLCNAYLKINDQSLLRVAMVKWFEYNSPMVIVHLIFEDSRRKEILCLRKDCPVVFDPEIYSVVVENLPRNMSLGDLADIFFGFIDIRKHGKRSVQIDFKDKKSFEMALKKDGHVVYSHLLTVKEAVGREKTNPEEQQVEKSETDVRDAEGVSFSDKACIIIWKKIIKFLESDCNDINTIKNLMEVGAAVNQNFNQEVEEFLIIRIEANISSKNIDDAKKLARVGAQLFPSPTIN